MTAALLFGACCVALVIGFAAGRARSSRTRAADLPSPYRGTLSALAEVRARAGSR